jgi:hypothetical protein
MVYTAQLSYAFRTGILTGIAGGSTVRLFTRATADHVLAWEKQQELRVGHWTPYDHSFVPPGGPELRGRVLRVARAAESMAAGRPFTGACDTPRWDRALFVDDGVGGCCIHDWPPCRCARCIVVPRDFDRLLKSTDGVALLTIVG